MSVGIMSLVFEYDMPELKTDKGITVPDSTAKFVLLALADHANDEGEGAYPGVKRLCKKTSMSSQTVCNALNALRHNGYTALQGKSKSDTNNYTINREKLSQPLGFQPLESGNSSGQNPAVPVARVKPSINHQLKQSMPFDWKAAHGEAITEEDVKKAKLESEAPMEFERAFGFGTLPWSSNTVWTKFQKFIVKLYTANPGVFRDYVSWREGDGKYKAFSNRKIRENPQAFMDTGYPEYEASKMYRKTDEARPEYQHVKSEPVVRVPRPASVPRPNIPGVTR
jgi:hypothetical protein